MTSLRSLVAAALIAPHLCHALIVSGPPRIPERKATDADALRVDWDAPGKDGSFDGAPLGNARIGVRVNGGVKTESLQLNDNEFYSGQPVFGVEQRPERRAALEATRERLAAGDLAGADKAARGMWAPLNMGCYRPVGTLYLHFNHKGAVSDYSRSLDIDSAVASVRYRTDGVVYTREYFTSHPDKTLVGRIAGDKPGSVSFTAELALPEELRPHGAIAGEGGDTLTLTAQAPTYSYLSPDGKSSRKKDYWNGKGLTVAARVRLIPVGGTISREGDVVRVTRADSVTILYGSATDWAGPFAMPGSGGVPPAKIVGEVIAAAAAKTPERLRADHVEDHRSLFRRFSVTLNGTQADRHGRFMQYARYDMIVSSRGGDRPHNQQGIWSHQWRPLGHGAHYLNENVEKHYGIIETANLAATGEPLWNWMDELAKSGALTAKTEWGFKGWYAPHCSDNWASTVIKGGDNEWAIWPMGGAWLCQNLWDHYAFGGDREFLRHRAYPLMKGAAEFCLDLLVDDGKGRLVTSPSTSAENKFLAADGRKYAVTRGATGDRAIVGQLFENCAEASQILGVDPEFRARLKSALARMEPYGLTKTGELREWPGDVSQAYKEHRHATHLLGVWPLAQITERGTPELFAGARKAMAARGAGAYHPDKAAMLARLKEKELAYDTLGSKPNKVCGQFGLLYAGMPEMLLFSHNRDTRGGYELELLPALPDAWKSGKVEGLRARGACEVSLEWEDGKLKKALIDSRSGTVPTIRYENQILDPKTDPRVIVNLVR